MWLLFEILGVRTSTYEFGGGHNSPDTGAESLVLSEPRGCRQWVGA